MIKSRIALTLAPLAAAIAFAPAALANDASVTWRDLDLGSAAGQAELDARIENAAATVCAGQAITGTRVQRPPSRDCLIAARSQIKAQVNARLARSEARRAHAAPANASAVAVR